MKSLFTILAVIILFFGMAQFVNSQEMVPVPDPSISVDTEQVFVYVRPRILPLNRVYVTQPVVTETVTVPVYPAYRYPVLNRLFVPRVIVTRPQYVLPRPVRVQLIY